MSIPSGFYYYCVAMGMPEKQEGKGIIFSTDAIRIADMAQSYELHRIANALAEVNTNLRAVTRAVKDTNKIFKGIHEKLKESDHEQDK